MQALLALLEQLPPPAVAVAAAIGGVVLLRFALKLLATLYAVTIRPAKNLKKTYGEWAVVTGATDGIGEAMATELARRGLNVLLVSRTESKLQATQAAILEKYGEKGVKVEYLQLDFGSFGSDDSLAKVKGAVSGKDVGVLVNNVGMSYDHPKYYEELSSDEVQGLIKLNVTSVAHMSHIVLAGMKERKRGAIINLSSVASQFDNPMLAGYSGTKAYGEMFSRSLQAELAYCKGNFSVQCQVPFFVVSKLSKIRKSSFFTPKPSAFARAACDAVGYETLCSPYGPHKAQLYALKEALPSFLTRYIVQSTHADLRKRAMRKKAKKAAEAKQN
mmetsp:Transcript_31728/g.100801  ORF Transcript_31728/g.100801 Transcript_31728/m.100801 type:complete len:331 (-) Transcript_31728:1591-2583(-)